MKKNVYVAPQVEVVDVITEGMILSASGGFSGGNFQPGGNDGPDGEEMTVKVHKSNVWEEW